MAWLCVDKSKNEHISEDKPIRHKGVLWCFAFDDDAVSLPKGTIKRLIGRELSWEDEPVEFTEVVE
jgi:hypothetical protein